MPSVKGGSSAQGSRPPLRKFYFHIASECVVHADTGGIMLSDLEAAHRYAVSAISSYMRCDPEEQDWIGWHIKIADDTGQTLVIVLFPTTFREAVGSNDTAPEPIQCNSMFKRRHPFE
jgi:hypothetical protein